MIDATQDDVITVAILDDDVNVRKDLSWLLDNIPGMRCSGAYADSEALMAGLAEQTADVLLLDVQLNDDSGVHAIEIVLRQFPALKIIMHSNYDDRDKIVRCIYAGARGYLSKNVSAFLLREAIIKINHGGSVWPAGYEEHVSAVLSHESRAKHSFFRRIAVFLRTACKWNFHDVDRR